MNSSSTVSNPPLAGWLLSLVTLFLVFMLSAFVLFAGCGFWQILALDKMQVLIQDSRSGHAKAYLNDALNPPFVLAWAAAEIPDERVVLSSLASLLQLLEDVQAEEFVSAAALLDNIETGSLKINRGQFAGKQEGNEAGELFAEIRDNLKKCTELFPAIGNGERQLFRWERDTQSYRRQLSEVAAEFAEFLSLKPPADSKADKPLPVYSSGVLKDLPVLEGLGDSIADFAQFKKALSDLKGEVKIPADNPNQHEVFLSKLETLRSSSLIATQELNSLSGRLQKLQTELENWKKELERNSNKVRVQLGDLIKFNARRRVNPLFIVLAEMAVLYTGVTG